MTVATRFVLSALAALLASGCAPTAEGPRPSYDPVTRRLVRLDYDTTGGGRIDARTYLDGTRPFRAELDPDGVGRVSRWEYFDASGRLTRVGTSSLGDGNEDTWTWAASPDGERRVDVSTARDRRPDRREFYRDDELVRVEEDVNGDGRLDKWEAYVDGELRTVAFDTTYRAGRPDRRAVYDAGGRFSHIEVDRGDGTFVREVTGAVP